MRAALLAVFVACSGADRYGAYIEVSGPEFDRLEFFFGGMFPNRRCGNDAAMNQPPMIRSTEQWNATTTGPQTPPVPYQLWRRQFEAQDAHTFTDPTTSFVYYVPSDLTDSVNGFPDTLGKVLVVVAFKGGQIVGVTRLDNFASPSDHINRYPLALAAPPPPRNGTPSLEVWGIGDAPACLRWDDSAKTTFIVREWDHDCDGLLTQICDYDGPPVLEDCDPLTFCHAESDDGCVTADYMGIFKRGFGTNSGGEETCKIFACANLGGGPPDHIGPESDYCLGANACKTDEHCDRLLGDCLLIDATPDLVCKVPVGDGNGSATKNALCAQTREGLPWMPRPTGACGSVVRSLQRFGADPINIHPQVVTDTSNFSCALEVTSMGSVPTFPITRLLIAVPDLNNVGDLRLGSFIVELQPTPGDCSMPQMTCTLATTPPLGAVHRCP